MTTDTRLLTADNARKILSILVEDAAELAESADSLPADMKLPDTVELAALVDETVKKLGVLRGVLNRRGAEAWGWKRNRYDHSGGWIARRKKNKAITHDVPLALGRLAPKLLVDPETGELDMPGVTKEQVQTILLRARQAVTMDKLKKTGLDALQIPWGDLITEEETSTSITIERAPAGGTP